MFQSMLPPLPPLRLVFNPFIAFESNLSNCEFFFGKIREKKTLINHSGRISFNKLICLLR